MNFVGNFNPGCMQRSLKLTLPNESVSLICLSCLSSSSTLSLVSLSTPTGISSSYCGGSYCSRWGTGCGMLICMDSADTCWEVGASCRRTTSDQESWATGEGNWLSNFLIITVIRSVKFCSSFFISLNLGTNTVACWLSWFPILVMDLVRMGLRRGNTGLGAMVDPRRMGALIPLNLDVLL